VLVLHHAKKMTKALGAGDMACLFKSKIIENGRYVYGEAYFKFFSGSAIKRGFDDAHSLPKQQQCSIFMLICVNCEMDSEV